MGKSTVQSGRDETFNRMRRALRMIAQSLTISELRAKSHRLYGLDPDEAIEFAYENLRETARSAVARVRAIPTTVKEG